MSLWQHESLLTADDKALFDEFEATLGELVPVAHGFDKSRIEIVEPTELQSLPKEHRLRERYKALTATTNKNESKANEAEAQPQEQTVEGFNYIIYFIDQMVQQRNSNVKLTPQQREAWNYVSHYCNHFGNILDNIENLQDILSKLNEMYLANQRECQHIHNKCIDLIEEQKSMENEARRLRKIVLYFNDLNIMKARLANANNIDVTSGDFAKIVKRIDECIDFLKEKSEIKESDRFLQQYKHLRLKCILMIRNHILARLNKAKQDTNKTTSNNKDSIESHQSELNIIEYRAVASTLRPLIQLVENQAIETSEYAVLLNDLQQLLLSMRQNDLKQQVTETMETYSATRDLAELTRAACSYVMIICLREHKLFSEFFDLDLVLRTSLMKTTLVIHSSSKPKGSTPNNATSSNASNTVSRARSSTASSRRSGTPVAYTPLFPVGGRAGDGGDGEDLDGTGGTGGKGYKGDSAENSDDDDNDDISGEKRICTLLKELCHVLYSYLRPFVIHEGGMDSLCDVVHILQQEIRESMNLQSYASNIGEFDKTIVRIIEDAQERLVYRTQIHIRDKIERYEPSVDDLNYFETLKKLQGKEQNEENKQTEEKDDKDGKDGAQNGTQGRAAVVRRYSDWSKVLEYTLETLSKIYPILGRSVFEFLAYESVAACVASLVGIAQKIHHKLSSVHSHLYLIKHLLILREQISPFEVDFSMEETTLDFSHLTDYLFDLVSAEGHHRYSLVEVLKNTIPTIATHNKNSKKTMEMVLKHACERFIRTQTNLLIGHVIALISKYEGATKQKRGKSLGENEKNAFVEEIGAVLSKCDETSLSNVNKLTELMTLYLQNPITQRILLRPILSNIESAFIQLRRIGSECAIKDEELNLCTQLSKQLHLIIT